MANNNEHLNYVFGADISAFQSAIKSVQSGLKSTGDKLKNIGSDLSTYVSLPLAALGGAAIKAFGDIQSLKNGLTAVTGSAKETEKQFARLKELAKLPGLGLQEVTKGSINLQVIGFTAEKAEKSIKAFGNAVATVGGGREQFERATYGLAQLANTDFPLGEDLNIIKDAIPQITPLLKEAFGTARSDDLKKLGITSAQVVDTIVNGLSKLPPVTGGVNASFENLKDGVFTNLAEIGEVINKNLDISALSDKIVSGLSSITQYFKELSPEVQKGILGFAALAIVIPPILVGLGALISTVLPALIGGFAALVSPVGLVVAAIAGAAVLIVKNWDTVSAYFTSGDGSKFWSTVKGYASDLWDNLKSIFNSIVSFGTALWKTFGDNITAIVGASFNLLKDIISNVLGVISNVFKVFASVLKGDWSGVWEGLKGITASIWNGIISLIKTYIMQISNVLSTFFKGIGADKISSSLSGLSGGIDKLFSKIQIPVRQATETVKDFKKELLGVGDTSTSTTKTETKTTSKGDSDAKDKIAQVYDDLEIGLKQIDSLFGASFGEKAKKRIDEYQQAINNLIKNGLDPASDAIKRLHAMQVGNVQLSESKAKDVTITDPKQKLPTAKFDGATRVSDAVATISAEKIRVLQLMDEMNQGITGSLNSGIASMGSGFVEMVGQMASGTMSMGGVISGLIGIMADMAVQIGKIAISTGVAMLGIKAAFKNPLTAIAAGVALVALGSMVKGSIAKATGGDTGGNGEKRTPFAKGGIVRSPTNAVFGEYPSAGRGNPEVVTPLNNLKGMLSDMGGFGSGTVDFRISGDSLVGTLSNHDKRNYRTN